MGLFSGLAAGYLKAMPGIDARNQQYIENQRADEKQKMWLAQQQRQQDAYEQAQRQLSANRMLMSDPTKYRGLMNLEGPMRPENQQWLQTVQGQADPQMLGQMANYMTPDEQLQRDLALKIAGRAPTKTGSDPLSMFIAVAGRKPKNLNELAAFAQSMKGKSGMDLTAFGPDGKPILSMGRGSIPPGTLTKSSEGDAQKKIMESASALDAADNLLGNIKLDWFSGPTQVGMAVKGAADKWLGGVGPKTGKELSAYSSGMAKINKQANEEIHRLTGAQMSATEADRLLKAIPNEKDSPAQALGKLQTFYNGLAMAEARYKFFLDQNRGAKPTEKDFESFSNGKNAQAKLALLSQYGYKPLSLEEIQAKIGTAFGAASGQTGEGQYNAESLIKKYGTPE